MNAAASRKEISFFGIPFEGPNASILMMNDSIVICRDKNGFRPQRGFVDDNIFFSGSEIGPCAFQGSPHDLPPAEPLLLNLTNGEIKPLSFEDTTFYRQQMDRLDSLSITDSPQQPIQFGSELLAHKKLQAGWSEELDRQFMQPLYNQGSGLLMSMADQGPIEGLVAGAFYDIGNFFKGKFSQVTNPPLAKREEKAYMSTKTVIGLKPELSDLKSQSVQGIL